MSPWVHRCPVLNLTMAPYCVDFSRKNKAQVNSESLHNQLSKHVQKCVNLGYFLPASTMGRTAVLFLHWGKVGFSVGLLGVKDCLTNPAYCIFNTREFLVLNVFCLNALALSHTYMIKYFFISYLHYVYP